MSVERSQCVGEGIRDLLEGVTIFVAARYRMGCHCWSGIQGVVARSPFAPVSPSPESTVAGRAGSTGTERRPAIPAEYSSSVPSGDQLTLFAYYGYAWGPSGA